MSHIKTPSFFGYNFSTHTWAVPSRIVHDFLGYSVLLMVMFQAVVGLMKFWKLQAGEKSFPFHGSLGKIIMILGAGSSICFERQYTFDVWYGVSYGLVSVRPSSWGCDMRVDMVAARNRRHSSYWRLQCRSALDVVTSLLAILGPGTGRFSVVEGLQVQIRLLQGPDGQVACF